MQTFLPYPDFLKSAESLDKKRCWKQVVEARQIIDCLEGKKVGWKNHPAVKMWEGYTDFLKEYYNVFLKVCITKHKINTSMEPMVIPYYNEKVLQKPFWWEQRLFHRSMRARLIEKDEVFYLPKFPNDKGYNGGKYWWPVMETKTFRII